MFKHINVSIIGDVQGVFFRRTVKHEASRQGISGFIRNEQDGTVYMEAEGPEEIIDIFSAWLKSGAGEGTHAIKTIDIVDGSFKAFEGFEIKE
ncbi:MAG: acylphosphatase [Patescibacteria group bacterium]